MSIECKVLAMSRTHISLHKLNWAIFPLCVFLRLFAGWLWIAETSHFKKIYEQFFFYLMSHKPFLKNSFVCAILIHANLLCFDKQ